MCIQGMLRLAAPSGGKLVCGRIIHRSAVNTMALLGIDPVWVMPEPNAGEGLAGRITPCGAVTVTAVLASMISCNQTLSIMLTYQMGREIVEDGPELALQLENTVILIAALIPWSIAGAVPIVTIGAKTPCLLFAFYLYIVPMWNFVCNFVRYKKKA